MKQPSRSHYNAICGDWVAKHKRTTRNGVGNCSSKTGSRRQSEKKTILKHFLKGFLEGKSLAPKWRKSADKSLSQPSCSHSNTIYEVQLQKTIVLRMQPQHEATFTQPLQCDLRRLSCKHKRTTRNGVGNCSSKTGSRRQSEKNDFEALFKRIFRRKITSAKMEKKTHFVRDFLQNSIGNSSTSTTCNPIYIAGTILQLQITMEFCRPHMHEKHLKPHLQCGTDPRMIRPWSDHTRDRLAPVAPQR